MKFGDAVIYQEGGKTYQALAVGPLLLPAGWKPGNDLPVGRELDAHTGADGELLLNLILVRPSLDMNGKPQDLSGTGSWSKLIQNRHDVAHASHAYTEEQKKTFGNIYAGGRWSLPESPVPARGWGKGK